MSFHRMCFRVDLAHMEKTDQAIILATEVVCFPGCPSNLVYVCSSLSVCALAHTYILTHQQAGIGCRNRQPSAKTFT